MIAFIRGQVVEKNESGVVLEAAGLGYLVSTTEQTKDKLAIGVEATLYIYEHIKEDCYDLYGFLGLNEQRIFVILRTVNGVGPKMALAILGLGHPADLQVAIATSDKSYLTIASGVGSRLADRIIVDLKDKLGGDQISLEATQLPRQDEARQALVALGYSPADAQKALANIDTSLPTDERVKQALQQGV